MTRVKNWILRDIFSHFCPLRDTLCMNGVYVKFQPISLWVTDYTCVMHFTLENALRHGIVQGLLDTMYKY